MGYTRIEESPPSGQGTGRDISSTGIVFSLQQGLLVGYVHEQRLAIPPGQGVILIVSDQRTAEQLASRLGSADGAGLRIINHLSATEPMPESP
ncbi:MAG: hypothetical protein ABII82_19575 [Verrucomicrobiota bacterium]